MAAARECAPWQLRFLDQVQWRYELIRPLVLFEECPTVVPGCAAQLGRASRRMARTSNHRGVGGRPTCPLAARLGQRYSGSSGNPRTTILSDQRYRYAAVPH